MYILNAPFQRNILNAAIGGVIQKSLTEFASILSHRIDIPSIVSGTEVTILCYPTNGNAGLPAGAPAVVNNKLQTITFTLTADMDHIGYNGVDYYDGFILEVDAPSVNRGYDLYKTWLNSTVLENKYAVLGDELVVNGYFDSDIVGWDAPTGGASGSWENGRFRLDTVTPYSQTTQVIPTEVGETYYVDPGFTTNDAGYIQVRDANNVTIRNNVRADGYLFVATTTTTKIRLHSPDTVGVFYFDGVSVRKAPGYGSAVNLGPGDTGLYDQVIDGMTGVAVNTLTPVSVGTDGSNTVTNLTPASGTITGDGAVFFGFSYPSILSSGQRYRVSGNSVVRDPAIKIGYTGSSSAFGVVTLSGVFEFDATALSENLEFARNAGGDSVDVDLTNISVNRLLENL